MEAPTQTIRTDGFFEIEFSDKDGVEGTLRIRYFEMDGTKKNSQNEFLF